MPAKRTVNLYYLGGLGENPDPDWRTPLNVSQAVYSLPPVYGYIEVPVRVAKRIISKWKVTGKDGTFDAFTTDPRIVRQIKAGQRKIDGQVINDPKYSIEQLESMLDEALLEQSIDEEPLKAVGEEPLKAVGEEPLKAVGEVTPSDEDADATIPVNKKSPASNKGVEKKGKAN